jgi:NAD(P)-dependent dehydrogenase (short-subunit alcohol dehydrogenase family)
VYAREIPYYKHVISSLTINQVDVAAYLPFPETAESEYDRVMDVNAKGIFHVIQAVAKVMQKQEPRILNTKRHGTRTVGRGSIVNIASAMSFGAVPAKAPYIASKHALLGITRSAGTRRLPRLHIH